MAFSSAGLARLLPLGNGNSRFRYTTADSLAAVAAETYFDGASAGPYWFSVGDEIEVVSGGTSQTRLIVTERNALRIEVAECYAPANPLPVPAAVTAGQAINKGQLDAAVAALTVSGLADGDKGDVVVSSSGTVWTVDARAVTPAKMSAAAAASRLLGRGSAAGGGDWQELTLSPDLLLTGTVLSTNLPASGMLDDSGVAGSGPKQSDTTVWLAGRLDADEANVTSNTTAIAGKADAAAFVTDSLSDPSGDPTLPQAVWKKWNNLSTKTTLLGTWDAGDPAVGHPNGQGWVLRLAPVAAGADGTFLGWGSGVLVDARAGFVGVAIISTASALYTAAPFDDVPIDTSGGSPANPPKLPTTPADGTRIRFSDPVAAGSWSAANPALIGRADVTATINGLTVDASLTGAGNMVEFKYRSSLNNWQRRIIPRNIDGLAPTTTKGDTLVRGTTGLARLAVGTDGQVLTANSGATNGVDWETPGAAAASPRMITKFGNGPAGTNVYYSGNFGSLSNAATIGTAFLCYFFDFFVGVASKTWTNLGFYVTTSSSTNVEMAMYNIDWSGTNPKPGSRVGSAVSILSASTGVKTAAWGGTLAPGRYLGRMIFDATGIAVRGCAASSLVDPLWGFDTATTPATVFGYTKGLGSQVTAPSTGEDITDGTWTKLTNAATNPAFFLS